MIPRTARPRFDSQAMQCSAAKLSRSGPRKKSHQLRLNTRYLWAAWLHGCTTVAAIRLRRYSSLKESRALSTPVPSISLLNQCLPHLLVLSLLPQLDSTCAIPFCSHFPATKIFYSACRRLQPQPLLASLSPTQLKWEKYCRLRVVGKDILTVSRLAGHLNQISVGSLPNLLLRCSLESFMTLPGHFDTTKPASEPLG